MLFLYHKAGYDDEDEKYDRSSFVVERFFRGYFTIANNSFTSHPLTQPDESEKLLEQLKQQVRHDLYKTLFIHLHVKCCKYISSMFKACMRKIDNKITDFYTDKYM